MGERLILPPGAAGQAIVAMAKAMAEYRSNDIARFLDVEPTPWEKMDPRVQANWLDAAQIAWHAIGERADLFWDANEPEYAIQSPEDALDGVSPYSIVEIEGGLRVWTRFYVEIPKAYTDDGDVDEWEILWFDTAGDAETAVLAARDANAEAQATKSVPAAFAKAKGAAHDPA